MWNPLDWYRLSAHAQEDVEEGWEVVNEEVPPLPSWTGEIALTGGFGSPLRASLPGI